MADTKISALTAATVLNDTDELVLARAGATLKAPADLIAAKPITFNLRTASYTMVLTDKGRIVSMNVASANNLSIPTNATVAFPVGTVITLRQAGAGQTTVVPISGVTLNARGAAYKLAGQYAYATLIKTATDTWELSGDIAV